MKFGGPLGFLEGGEDGEDGREGEPASVRTTRRAGGSGQGKE